MHVCVCECVPRDGYTTNDTQQSAVPVHSVNGNKSVMHTSVHVGETNTYQAQGECMKEKRTQICIGMVDVSYVFFYVHSVFKVSPMVLKDFTWL